jgi:hypothetical protein
VVDCTADAGTAPLEVLSCDHLLRRLLEHVLAEGFRVEQRECYKAGIVERLSARRPE